MSTKKPAIIITGASGFVGRAVIDELKSEYRIFAIARRSQYESNAPVHKNIAWMRADIADHGSISRAFREIATAGGADFLLHLAAYYDFSGDPHAGYQETNVDGTRHVLELARDLNLKLFIFVSSAAACAFPKAGNVLDESSPPDGDHIYAWSKRQGEKLVSDKANRIPSCIVRLGAVFNDWCEYPPLYIFLNTWLSRSWKARILSGKGQSAIPYIHIRDIVTFFRQLLDRHDRLDQGEILLACTNGSTTHAELFELATRYYEGKPKKPFFMPKLMCALGLYQLYAWGLLTRNIPFERPWMHRYIDLQLNTDIRRTCQLLDWQPDRRHRIERRIAFLVERLKSEPDAWHSRNMAILQNKQARPGLKIYTALVNLETEITTALFNDLTAPENKAQFSHFQETDKSEITWFIKLIYRLLQTSLYNSNKLLILNYFEVSGLGRFEAGYRMEEIRNLLIRMGEVILRELGKRDEMKTLDQEIYDRVSMPIEFGIDELEYQHQLFLSGSKEKSTTAIQDVSQAALEAREQLEETIWSCLVQRK